MIDIDYKKMKNKFFYRYYPTLRESNKINEKKLKNLNNANESDRLIFD